MEERTEGGLFLHPPRAGGMRVPFPAYSQHMKKGMPDPPRWVLCGGRALRPSWSRCYHSPRVPGRTVITHHVEVLAEGEPIKDMTESSPVGVSIT